jgi:2,3-dihydroxybenzoate-AMP ligase
MNHLNRLTLLPDGAAHLDPEMVQRYRACGYWGDELLDDHVLRHAQRTPDAVAVQWRGGWMSFGKLAAAVDRLAVGFRALGLGPGQRVVVQLTNVPQLIVGMLAIVRSGAAPVLTPPALREREVAHIAQTASATAILLDSRIRRGECLSAVRRWRASNGGPRFIFVVGCDDLCGDEIDLDTLLVDAAPLDTVGADNRPRSSADIALYLLSGGTTGLPKLIPRTHRDYVYNLTVSQSLTEVSADTVYLAAMPITHNFALGCPGALGVLAAGGRVVLSATNDPETVLQAIAMERVTTTAAVPGLALQWAEAAAGARLDLNSLDVVQVGGARPHPAHAARICGELRCRMQQVYGMAEGMLNFTRLSDPFEVILETQGRPASPGDEWRIVDPDDQDVAPGSLGQLITRGPYTIRSYMADPAVNAQAFTHDGFYRTGDLVRLHPTGNFVVEGRLRDVINRGGEKLSPRELEELLGDHKDLATSVVVGVPDPILGEKVCLIAVARPGRVVDLGRIREDLDRRGVARFKLPERLVLVDNLPLTAVGKIDRAAIRGQLATSDPVPNERL